tara:strand:+ start:62 stop:541 length:480 start_codon:yes stop_codon:yes gene_type:complete
MKKNINLLILLPALALIFCALYIFYAYANFTSGTSGVVYSPFLDAIMGGYGNTVPADFALILGILVIIMHLTLMISTTNILGKILRFLTGRIFGLVVFLLTLMTVLANGALIYLKFFDEVSAPLYTSISGNGYAEIIICLCSIMLLFQSKGAAKTTPSD